MPTKSRNDYRRPEDNSVSLPLLEQWVASLDPGLLADAAQLYLERVRLDLEAQRLQPGCLRSNGFPTWVCCEPHRQLKAKVETLRQRLAAAFPVPDLDEVHQYQSGSEMHWRSLGIDCRGWLNEVVTTSEGFSHYAKTVIHTKSALDFFGHISDDDERHGFAALYRRFLYYQHALVASHRRTPFEERATDNCCGVHRSLAAEWRSMQVVAEHLTRSTPKRRLDTWQEYPPLSADWWEGLVLFWREDAQLVVD
ncbi:MAG TPA: hypothetical protein VGH44_06145 [Candidatus Saccharimonadia bacterium]|jgi:hypothetical protein